LIENINIFYIVFPRKKTMKYSRIYDIKIKMISRLSMKSPKLWRVEILIPSSLSKSVWVPAVSLFLTLTLFLFWLAYRARFAPWQPLPAFQLIRSTSFRYYIISLVLSALSTFSRMSSSACLRESEFSASNYVTRRPWHCACDSRSCLWDFRGEAISLIKKSHGK